MPRKKFEPTDRQRHIVYLLAGVGYSHDLICLQIRDEKDKPISLSTLHRYFAKELATAKGEIDGKAYTKFLRAVEDGKPWAVTRWLEIKCWHPQYGGWREPPTQNAHLVGQVGPDGNPALPSGAPLQLLVNFEKPTTDKPDFDTDRERYTDLSAEPEAKAKPDVGSGKTKRGKAWTVPEEKPKPSSPWSKEAYEQGTTDFPNPYNLGCDPT